ncbi:MULTISPECIES: alkaline phosphatase [Photorhabdus]|uniref:Alkaline phosphatase n=2 Tax=Photorhabdus asymbiotica TaxID=291112 RepID=C7BJQ7_PHOAA|nr:alkaline phosphatase [Photorhabdus asymbiotica]RKS58092.1 alkaline phosphatase [Photorhabdus asymbiotica]CAQ82573.1 alkaline phosphatase [Photorhabdus asymbiotica]
MSQKYTKNLMAVMISALISGGSLPVLAVGDQGANQIMMEERAVKGNITEFGGARRMTHNQTEALKAAINNNKAKNVILFIGDGMGDSEITIARNYAEGAGGFFKGIDALPFTGQYTHYSLNKGTHKPNYVTDSAASATAWATGIKTYNGALAVDVFGKDHQTLLELAKANGKGTGNVTTARVQDATPAALYAHVTGRDCYGPKETTKECPTNALENGGRGSITEQLLVARADVTLGGGAKIFTQKSVAGDRKGKTLEEQALEQGYQLVRDAKSLASINEANQKKPLLGLFHEGNMDIAWEGPKAVYHGNIDNPPVSCKVNSKRNPNAPTLAQMTEKAIDLLKENKNGFFLQVESGSIDKQDHKANPCGQIGETVVLDEAVQVGLKYAREHGDTLVIVTADHAHSSQIIEAGVKSPGLAQALVTKDGSVMAVSYSDSEGEEQEHTGAQLRVAAYGPQAANVVGLTDQTDLFFTIRSAMELK